MLTSFRAAAKRLPVISRLIAQRDELHGALAQAAAECEHLRAGLALVTAQHEAHRAVQDLQLAHLAHGLQVAQTDLAELGAACGIVPPGHFYSPLPAVADIRRDEARIFGAMPREIPGVDLREGEQLELLERFAALYPSIPFRHEATPGLRYQYDNTSYSFSDAIMLHCMLRTLKPRRLIEIGSGYSSCVTLDTDQHFLGGKLQATFVEPYPELLLSLTTPQDHARITIIPKRLQDVELELFRQLSEGDILFVDSTHISKVDSDVNRLFFDILPVLAPGVVIHLHDIFYPFEYPKEWIYQGHAWNELYLLRAFLQYNDSFRVLLMNSFMSQFHEEFFSEKMPLCLANTGGSIWLRKQAMA